MLRHGRSPRQSYATWCVVDRGGKAVGVVSALDFVRALSGLPPRHPPRFDVDCSSAGAFPDGNDD